MIRRQSAALYLRGSLANITMADLTKEQRQHVEELTKNLAGDEVLAKTKRKYMRLLKETFKSDYRDDIQTAECDFTIIIWRAVVQLFYHYSYSFHCGHCNATSHLGQNGRVQQIDRRWPVCKACNHVKVADPGSTTLQAGQYLPADEFAAIQQDAQVPPRDTSPICCIPLKKKYDDPQRVIDDPKQRSKYFAEFVWGYYNQQVNENKRKEFRPGPVPIYGPADEIATEELISLCCEYRITHNYTKEVNPENGFYKILLYSYYTPPEFSIDYCALVHKYRGYGVNITATAAGIMVQETPNAPHLSIVINRPEFVQTIHEQQSGPDSEEMKLFDYLYLKKKRATMSLEREIDDEEALAAVRNSLPNDCQPVFDIYLQRDSDTYKRFVAQSLADELPDTIRPPASYVARFLGVHPRAVKRACEQIRHHLLANAFISVR